MKERRDEQEAREGATLFVIDYVAPLIGTPHISNSIYCLNIMMIFGINSLPYAADHTIERSFFYIIPISIP